MRLCHILNFYILSINCINLSDLLARFKKRRLFNRKCIDLENDNLNILPFVFETENEKLDFKKSGIIKNLLENTRKIKRIRSIKATGKGITKLREGLSNLENLKILDLSDNKISLISKHFYQLKKLKSLYLDNNQITRLDESLKKLCNLEDLSLSKNYIYSIPNIFNGFKKLKSINLSKNYISDCPILNISEVDLSENLISDLERNNERSCVDLSKLKKLDLSNNNLKIFPDWIKDAINITHINLSNNNLKTVPKFIFDLQNLKSIDLRHNNIQEEGTDINLGRKELLEKKESPKNSHLFILIDSYDLCRVKEKSLQSVYHEMMKNDLYWNIEVLSNLSRPSIEDLDFFEFENEEFSSNINFICQESHSSVKLEIEYLIQSIISYKTGIYKSCIQSLLQDYSNDVKSILIDLRIMHAMLDFNLIDIDKLIDHLIHIEKECVFDFEMIIGTLDKNYNAVEYWKYSLSEILGFDEKYRELDDCGRILYPGYVLESFFKKFRPRYVIHRLCKYISLNNKVKNAFYRLLDSKNYFNNHIHIESMEEKDIVISEKMVEFYLIKRNLLISNKKENKK